MLNKIAKIPRKLKTFITLPMRDKMLTFEAFFLLVFSEFTIRLMPFSFLQKTISTDETDKNQAIDAQKTLFIARGIRRAVQMALWDPKCYAQALTAKIMLKRRRIQGALFLGVGKDDKGKFIAHAWTISNNYFLTGEAGHENYTVVATYR